MAPANVPKEAGSAEPLDSPRSPTRDESMFRDEKSLCQSCHVEMVRDSAISGVVCPQCGAVRDDSMLVQHIFDRKTQELQGLHFFFERRGYYWTTILFSHPFLCV